MNDLISIIVPVYNSEKYLDCCLTNIRAQKYTNLQIILVNDGSTDNSKAICEKYTQLDDRFLLINSENKGSSAARNLGLKYVKGNYICFIDSDDYVDSRYIALLYENAIKYEADISLCDYVYFDNNNPPTSEDSDINEIYFTKEEKETAISKIYYSNYSFVTPWGKIIKTSLFENILFPEGKCYDDESTMYLVYLKANKFVYNHSKYYYYFYNDLGISKTIYLKNIADLLPIFESRREKFLEYNYQKLYAINENRYFLRLIKCYLNTDTLDKNELYSKIKISCKNILHSKSNFRSKLKSLLFLIFPKLSLFYYKFISKK